MKRFFFTSVLGLLTLILASCNSKDDEFVDLGLSVKWATCNVGTNFINKYGAYYYFDEALKLENDRERLPTKEEFQELIDNCTWLSIEENGVYGKKVTSKKNGNSIFLPLGGGRYEHGIDGMRSFGTYYSSSVYDEYKTYYLYTSNETIVDYDYRRGRSVRLVQDVKK